MHCGREICGSCQEVINRALRDADEAWAHAHELAAETAVSRKIVEAVRGFPKYNCAAYKCTLLLGEEHTLACDVYRKGVEAVQALLSDER
jgi:hypothetical protein